MQQPDATTTVTPDVQPAADIAPQVPAQPSASASDARQRILSRGSKLAEETVHVSQWGMDVLVVELTGKARARLLQHAVTSGGNVDLERIYPDLVIASAHFPGDRLRIFEDTDRDELLQDSGAAIETVASVAGRLSGLDAEAAKRAEGN